MVSSIQLKLRGFSIVDVVQDQWEQIDTNTAGNIFTQFLTAVENFFGGLIGSFANILPSAEQIHHLLDVLAHYLVPAVILILGVTCFICLFPFILVIFGFLFSCISATVVFLFSCISTTVRFLFSCISTTVRFIFPGLMKCLGFGGSAAVKMMKAPGMATVMIARASFEACPQAYFAGLRLLSG